MRIPNFYKVYFLLFFADLAFFAFFGFLQIKHLVEIDHF